MNSMKTLDGRNRKEKLRKLLESQWRMCAALSFGIASTSSALTIEAEDMTLSGFTIQNSEFASNGKFLQTGTAGTATISYSGTAGTWDISVYYFDESDGLGAISLLVNGLQVDAWIADQNLGSAGVEAVSRTSHTTKSLVLNPGDTLTITATRDNGEYGRIDNLIITPAKSFSYQAEQMALSGYTIETNAAAANGQLVRVSSQPVQGIATQLFGGNSGNYTIDTRYFDETDGISTFELWIDGVLRDTWLANKTTGTSGISAASLTSHKTEGVLLQPGSIIELRSNHDTAEYGRLDEVLVYGGVYVEAEDMALLNHAVESYSGASGGKLISLTGEQGAAKYVVVEGAGANFDLTIDYFDETDGKATFKIYLNDRIADAWTANLRLGSAGVSDLNLTRHITRRLALKAGDVIEFSSFGQDGETCRLDGFGIEPSSLAPSSAMTWNADGSLASLVLDGSERLNTSATSGVDLRVFDGYSVKTVTRAGAGTDNNLVTITYDQNYSRLTFRADPYEHHIALRLIGMEGISRDDASLNLRLVIPFASQVNAVSIDGDPVGSIVGSSLLIDWPFLATRGWLAGGVIALYAEGSESQNQTAVDEIYETHRDTGNLSAYYAWIDGFPLTETQKDLHADSDADGLSNLIEYAFGGSPDSGNLVETLPTIAHSSGTTVFSYMRRRDATARGLSYQIFWDDDLTGPWTPAISTEIGGEILDVDFERVDNEVSFGTSERGFLRLKTELQK